MEIPEDSDMLLWDRPLSEQPAKVRKALSALGFRTESKGEFFYRRLSDIEGGEQQASTALLAAGIKGIKYLDGTSRTAGDGSYDYVIFDGADTEIVGTAFSWSATKSVTANIDRGLRALAEAVTGKTTVHRAMFRSGMGWVDFVWGDEGKVKPSGKTVGGRGLSHIVEARMRKDGLTETQALRVLSEMVRTIAAGAETERISLGDIVSVKIEHDGYRAALVRRPGSNAWVVTAFELSQVRERPGIDARSPTQTAPTPSRDDLGAGPVASDAVPPSLGGATRRDSTERGSPAGAESPGSMAEPGDAGNDTPMFSHNSIGPNPPPQPAPATRNRWHAPKQRVMNLTSPEALDKLIYELQDRFVDLKRIQAHLRGIARYRQRPERCFFGSAAPAWRIEWGALVCELLTHDTGATAGGCLLHRQRGTRAKLVRSRQ